MRALGNSLEDRLLELCTFTVRSLVGELTSHKPCGAVKKKKLKEEEGSGQQPRRVQRRPRAGETALEVGRDTRKQRGRDTRKQRMEVLAMAAFGGL